MVLGTSKISMTYILYLTVPMKYFAYLGHFALYLILIIFGWKWHRIISSRSNSIFLLLLEVISVTVTCNKFLLKCYLIFFRGKKVCKTAPIAGETKVWQYITLMKKIYLIDCPGIVPGGTETDTEKVIVNTIELSAEKVHHSF